MRNLILMRHAKAEKDTGEKNDIDRVLTDRGEEEAAEMAHKLHRSGFKPDLLISSNAKRTYKTARIIADEFGIKHSDILQDERLYEAGMEDLLKVVRHIPDNYASVVIVGHNPLFTGAPGYLSKTFVEHLPTAAYSWLSFKLDSWMAVQQHAGVLEKVEVPKKHEA